MAETGKKLGLVGLTGIVFGSMIGSGIFNIVQNMAYAASVGAVIISWIITAIGIMFLVFTFKTLSDLRPDLDAGIYQYAQVGFGNYVGFNIAWGYWLCTAFANEAYAVMLNDALGVFFPSLLDHGWHSVIFGSALIWSMFFIVLRGVHSASVVNVVISTLKIASLVLMVVIIFLFFDFGMFRFDFWGKINHLGGLGDQIERTMLVTLWCFIGIEGAVVMSARAKRVADVGRASIIGFLLAWVLYASVSVAAYGVMSQPQMAELENPSVAYLLRYVCGDWAYYFVIISVICSLFGGWIAWTLICAQVPYEAAEHGIMPQRFRHLSSRGVPSYGLFIASLIMQVFFLGVIMAESVYMAAIEVSGMMVLPAYLFCGIFLWMGSNRPGRYLCLPSGSKTTKYRVIGVICTIYCLWLMYAGGLLLLLFTSLFYMPGVYFYVKARQENAHSHLKIRAMFTRREKLLFIALFVCSMVSLMLIE